jgi:predicted MFS family arabinose efflux permease
MLAGYVFAVISSLVLSHLIGTSADTVFIFVAYPAFNFLRGLSQPAASAVVANSEIRNLRTGLSLMSIAGNLGFAVGPALGGILAQRIDYASVFLLSAAVPVVTSAITIVSIEGGLLAEPGSDDGHQSPRSGARVGSSLLLFFLLTLCAYMAIGYEIAPISVYVQNFLDFNPETIGYLFATNGIVIVLFQLPLSGFFFRARRLTYPIVVSCGLAAFSFIAAAFSTTFLEWEGVMIVLTFGEIFLTVPSQIVATVFSRAENRGTYQGYYSAASIGGRSLSALVGLSSFQFFTSNPKLGWYAIAAFSMVLVFCFLFLARPLQREYVETSNQGTNEGGS